MKKCTKCKKDKPLTEFHKSKQSKDGYRWQCKQCDKVYTKAYRKANPNKCEICGVDIDPRAKRCIQCKPTGEESYHWKGGKTLSCNGYVYKLCKDHPNANSRGYVMEHRLVMETYLGRFLTKKENVHHKNGIRDDNRFENLELWTRAQPVGSRVEDKIAWAIEFLEEYDYKVKKKL